MQAQAEDDDMSFTWNDEDCTLSILVEIRTPTYPSQSCSMMYRHSLVPEPGLASWTSSPTATSYMTASLLVRSSLTANRVVTVRNQGRNLLQSERIQSSESMAMMETCKPLTVPCIFCPRRPVFSR